MIRSLWTRVKSVVQGSQPDDHEITLVADALCRSVDGDGPQEVAEEVVAEMSPAERRTLLVSLRWSQ